MGVAEVTGWSALSSPLLLAEQLLSIMMSNAISSVGLIGLGTLCGLLMPRPRFLEGSASRAGSLLWSTPPDSSVLRRVALLFHGAVIVRDIWNHHIAAEAHAVFLGIWSWLCGTQAVASASKQELHPQQQQQQQSRSALVQNATHDSIQSCQQITSSSTRDWYVTEEDLAFFKRNCESDEPLSGATSWVAQMDKNFANCSYAAWRRILPSGKAEYKSVTVSLDATAEEFTDFYLDDNIRPQWDTMVSHHSSLEVGSPADRCQVVHWIRSFPFAFLSDREYVIARRQFRDANGCIYVCTKSIKHDQAPEDASVVRMDVFWSMWRSRTVPCPRGTDKPACETVLLHHEQFKIPEHLARFAIKAGMGGFVKKMGPAVRAFVDARRERADAFAADPAAYGVQGISRTAASVSSLDAVDTTTDGTGSVTSRVSDLPASLRRRGQQPKPNMLKRAAVMSVGIVAAVAAIRSGRGLLTMAAGAAQAVSRAVPGQRRAEKHKVQSQSSVDQELPVALTHVE